MSRRQRYLACVAAPCLLAGLASPASAQPATYPFKPIRLIVPFPPGGGTDIVARSLALRMTETLGQSVVVDNRPGGGGTIGAAAAVRASPDGYTLLIVSAQGYTAAAALYDLPYDAVKDVQPIVMIGESAFVLVVHPSVPIHTVSELVNYAKSNPGRLNYGSGGETQLAPELFNQMAGTKMTHIPYKGNGPALTALIANEIQLIFSSALPTAPLVKAGRLRAIGITTMTRSKALPDVPPVSDTIPGFEVVNWFGLLGPKGLPKHVVTVWNRETEKALQSDEIRDRMSREGLEPAGGSPQRLHDAIRRDVEKWTRVVADGKLGRLQ